MKTLLLILGLGLLACVATLTATALDTQGRGVTGSLNITALEHDVLHEIQMERGTCYLLKNKLAYPVGTLTMLSCVR